MAERTFTETDIRDIIINAYEINAQFGNHDSKFMDGYRTALNFVRDSTYNTDE